MEPSVYLALVLSGQFLGLFPSVGSIDCYQFTWPGSNDTKATCADKTGDFAGNSQPCLLPFVLTKDSKEPDLNSLNKKCSWMTCPPYKCTTEYNQCVRWAWYDVKGNLYNYTLFCGSVSDLTYQDTKGIISKTSGCWEESVSTFTKKVCVCNDENFCNGSPVSSGMTASVLLIINLLFLLARSLQY
ncbi:uncharacterized protein [Macrobrachium rosenbergii]|uniref:uncharacterized protein n=1 Tax=Macrobrachium rosenbergii TaxID=79674 RepID=UPI0034D6A93F